MAQRTRRFTGVAIGERLFSGCPAATVCPRFAESAAALLGAGPIAVAAYGVASPPMQRLLVAGVCVALALLAGCGSAPRGVPTPTAAPLPRPAPPTSVSAPVAAVKAAPVASPDGRTPPSGPERDGPSADPPPDLHRVPDAEPRIEAVRPGGPNKPYEVLGQAYVPLQGDPPVVERGLASWYGAKFHGRPTSSGEIYDMYAMTAAHKTLPIPSYVRVRNPANGREVVLRVNDRGPFHAARLIDLSYTAALKLGLLAGVATVEVERITHEAIRSGAWRPAVPGDDALATTTAAPTAPTMPAPGSLNTGHATSEVMTPSGQVAASPAPATLSASANANTNASTNVSASANANANANAADPPLPTARAGTAPARGFWVQLGAFRQRSGASGLRREVEAQADWLSPLLAIFAEAQLHRLQAGPYASRDEAASVAQRLRQALQLVPLLLERR